MTSEEIAEIEARAAAATPGPWRRTVKGDRREAREWLIGQFDASEGDKIHGAGVAAAGKTIEEECLSTAITGNGPTSEANAIFIASARTDVPRLCAALRERDAEIARLRAIVERFVKLHGETDGFDPRHMHERFRGGAEHTDSLYRLNEDAREALRGGR